MKALITAAIRFVVFHLPRGVREALFSACVERIGLYPVFARLRPQLRLVEVAANGDRGVITGAADDMAVLPEYALSGTFSASITALMTEFLRDSGGTFIDIGANIGLTVIPFARMPGVHCLAFEPEPRNFNFLRRNVARNAPDASIELHQVAPFHSRSQLSLAIAEDNLGDHRVTLGGVPGRRSIAIEAFPLDDFAASVRGKLAVKIDTQGAEPFVIAGGAAVLARASILAIEFCPYLMRQLGGDPATVIALIVGFERVAVMPGGVTETPVFVTPQQAQAMLRHKVETATDSDGDYVDILAVRSARGVPA